MRREPECPAMPAQFGLGSRWPKEASRLFRTERQRPPASTLYRWGRARKRSGFSFFSRGTKSASCCRVRVGHGRVPSRRFAEFCSVWAPDALRATYQLTLRVHRAAYLRGAMPETQDGIRRAERDTISGTMWRSLSSAPICEADVFIASKWVLRATRSWRFSAIRDRKLQATSRRFT